MSFTVSAFERDLLETVAGQLDLRVPNRRAIETLGRELHDFYSQPHSEFFEGVIDVATGVGKTYIIAGAIDYLAAQGVRNFAIIAPGATILNKTVAQFTPGDPKSLVGGMNAEPVVITAENFRTAAMRAEMDHPDRVKLFVFTVQSLTKPTTKTGRRTHSFQEGLGGAFYEHLEALEDLVVFADEHHTYHGPAFSRAIRDLTPLALIGLTATPNERQLEQAGIPVIYRYPLAAAIADRLVKTPVIVGRKDDRTDEHTQLLDGARLLDAKREAIERYRAANPDLPTVEPVMLVNCENIDHAENTAAFLRSDGYADGRYADAVLVVHSRQSDEALAALETVEEPDSKVRIIVQVGMLKEGWDVRSVFVIASLRASVSEILTEQTLGRGLRLPFGTYTDWPILDELEVLAHERYEELLKRAGVLAEAFIDYETRLVERTDSQGDTVTVVEQVPVPVMIRADVDGGERIDEPQVARTTVAEPGATPNAALPPSRASVGATIAPVPVTDRPAAESAPIRASAGSPLPVAPVLVASVEDRTRQAETAARQPLIGLKVGAPDVLVPVMRTEPVPIDFVLELVTDTTPFRELGRRLAVDPDYTLRRTRLEGHDVIVDGKRIATVGKVQATDKVLGSAQTVLPDQARDSIIRAALRSRVVPQRQGQAAQLQRLLAEVEAGAGDKADALLSAYPDRVVRGLLDLIVRAQRALPAGTQSRMVTGLERFSPKPRPSKASVKDRALGWDKAGTGYTGWNRSLQAQVWFDSRPEFVLALLLDDSDDITWWTRLLRNDLPILWNGARNTYNPDFLVRAVDGSTWVIETKSDRDLTDPAVQGKRHAAQAWANTINASGKTDRPWGYLLVGETDLSEAKGSWANLRAATA